MAYRKRSGREWLVAFRDLFTASRVVYRGSMEHPSNACSTWFEGRRCGDEGAPSDRWGRVSYSKADPSRGLTFAEVVDGLDLPKTIRRPKHVRAFLLSATTLGMIRVENERYHANASLFETGAQRDELIDLRPIVKGYAGYSGCMGGLVAGSERHCPSCGHYLSARLGCHLCEECGLKIDKPVATFVCRRCGKFGGGWVDVDSSITGKRYCDVRNGRYTQPCVGFEVTAVPARSTATTARYWKKESVFTCPYCGRSKESSARPDSNGLVRCDSLSCELPFYLPEAE